MKKIIIVLAAIVLAVSTQAATVSWKITTGGSDYAGMTVYAFANTTTASILSACTSKTESDWSAMFADASVGANTGTGARLTAAGDNNGIKANDTLTFVIVDGAIADGSKYYVFDSVTIPEANVYEPPTTGTALGFKMTDLTVTGSGTFTAVPEPTSGLLMLVGLAGLALRRRRA